VTAIALGHCNHGTETDSSPQLHTSWIQANSKNVVQQCSARWVRMTIRVILSPLAAHSTNLNYLVPWGPSCGGPASLLKAAVLTPSEWWCLLPKIKCSSYYSLHHFWCRTLCPVLGETAQAVAFSGPNPVRVLVSHSIDCGRSELPGLLGIAFTGQPWLRHSGITPISHTSLTLSGRDYPRSVRAFITSILFYFQL
jgi:hypothetical protein